jgi:hypothetical protein
MSTPSLTRIISTIPALPPPEAMDLLSNLVPELIPSITFLGQRSVSHPKHPGTHDLNDLAYKYLHLGNALSSINASLSNRLAHYDLHPCFEDLYKSTNQLFDQAAVPGFLRYCRQFSLACGCCVGYPWIVIPRGDRKENALDFDGGVWDAIWKGKAERCGSANRDMLVEALGRGIDDLSEMEVEVEVEVGTKTSQQT